MSETDTEPPPSEDASMSDPAVSAFLTKQLCMNGGSLLIADIPNHVGLSPEHIAGILREEGKRFPEPEPGTVMAQSPVRLCFGYLGNRCQAMDCDRLHLCRYFILGHCFIRGNKHGRFCKFSHNIHEVANRAVLKANDISNLNEKELRVLLQLNDPSCLPEVCHDYKGGRNETPCPKGAECRRLHVCQYFARGQCRYFRCNRSHNLLDDITIEVIKVRGISVEMANNIQILRTHQCNEARKEPLKDERPKRNKDHPRSCDSRIHERRDFSRPQTPDSDGSSESSVSGSEYKRTAPNSRNFQRGQTHRPQSACPHLLPSKMDTTYPTKEFLARTQTTEKANCQTTPLPPTKLSSTIPVTAPHPTIKPVDKLDLEKILTVFETQRKTAATKFTAERHFQEMKPQIAVKPLIPATTKDTLGPATRLSPGIPLSAKLYERLSLSSPPPVTTADIADPSATASIWARATNKGGVHASMSSPSTLNTNEISLQPVMAKTNTQPTNRSSVPPSVNASPPLPKDTKDLATTSGSNLPDNITPSVRASVNATNPLPTYTKRPATPPRTNSLDNSKQAIGTTSTPTMPTGIQGSVSHTASPPPIPNSPINLSSVNSTYPATVSPTQIQHLLNSNVQTTVHPSPTSPTPYSTTFIPAEEYSPRATTHRKTVNVRDLIEAYDDTPVTPAPKVSQAPVPPVVSPEDCGDPNEICFYHIWAFCQRKSGCPQMHFHLPYRWQIEKEPEVWEDLPWMENIEKAYCDPDNTSSGRHDINFERMISSYHQIRRLSTASSVTQPPDHLMTTEWVWHWKNEFGKWIEYGKHGGKEKATIASADLETIYLADKNAVVPFQAGAQRYQINFKDMIQKNLVYSTEKEVCRRPRFVSKEDIDKLKPSNRTKLSTNQPPPSVPAIPGYWDSTAVPDVGYKLVEISSYSTEFKEIEKSFKKTMPQHSIQKVQRIQNITLWNFFQMQKETMKKQNKKEVLEKQLFHGTNTIYMDGICHNNFDWRVCGLNGTVYGKGSYFARDASYSHNYCRSSSTSRTMFLARILVGDFIKGSSDYTRPPSRPSTKNTFFDSCVDNLHDPSIFVIFDKPQIYPEYIMEYSESKSCCIS